MIIKPNQALHHRVRVCPHPTASVFAVESFVMMPQLERKITWVRGNPESVRVRLLGMLDS